MNATSLVPQRHELRIPGHGRTAVTEIPGPEGAPVVMLLHGLGATGDLNWALCYGALAPHFRVVSIDHRGHGNGIRTRRFKLEDCAGDAIAADALGIEQFVAVGYSMGGPIASLTWRRRPDRVKGLVLCATARHFASRGLSSLARVSLPFASAAVRVVPGLVQKEATHRMLQSIQHPEMRSFVSSQLLGHDPATVIQAARAVTSFSSHDWIGEVDVPTAVIVTTQDELVPEPRQRKLAASIPGAEVFEVDGGHAACATAPNFAPTLVAACRSVVERAESAPAKEEAAAS